MTSGGLFVRWVTWGKRKKPRRGHFSSLAHCNFSSVPAAIYSPKSVRMSSAFLGLSAGMFLSFCWYLRPWSDDESWVIYGWWNMLDLKYLSWIIWLEDAYCESLPWRPTLSFRISVQTDGGCCLVRNLIFFFLPLPPPASAFGIFRRKSNVNLLWWIGRWLPFADDVWNLNPKVLDFFLFLKNGGKC